MHLGVYISNQLCYSTYMIKTQQHNTGRSNMEKTFTEIKDLAHGEFDMDNENYGIETQEQIDLYLKSLKGFDLEKAEEICELLSEGYLTLTDVESNYLRKALTSPSSLEYYNYDKAIEYLKNNPVEQGYYEEYFVMWIKSLGI